MLRCRAAAAFFLFLLLPSASAASGGVLLGQICLLRASVMFVLFACAAAGLTPIAQTKPDASSQVCVVHVALALGFTDTTHRFCTYRRIKSYRHDLFQQTVEARVFENAHVVLCHSALISVHSASVKHPPVTSSN